MNTKVIPVLAMALAAGPLPVAGPAAAQTAAAQEQITTHDNDRPAGRLQGGVLSLSLRAGRGRWFPEGSNAAVRVVEALGEEGAALTIPSPLIRVPRGTVIQVAIRNTLDSTLRIHGFCDRGKPCEPVVVPAGQSRELEFTAAVEGTFHYWATTLNDLQVHRDGIDSQLGGALVVDGEGGPAPDRIFVMGVQRAQRGVLGTELAVINGRSWPHTERLRHAVGDTVRWRVINLSAAPHAMHLHGFYFTVDRRGDGLVDAATTPGNAPRSVTEQMPPGRTIALTWVPERPGNWLFHCHMLNHMLPASPDELQHAQHDSQAAGMAGLVLGVLVAGDSPAPVPDADRRRLQLIIEPDTRHGTSPSYKVSLTGAGDPPPRVSDRAVPGPVIVLTRGVPVAVDVVNRLKDPTAIHWHGIELESFNDGVPDFGGTAGSVTPPVAPGQSFTARFTPVRAGTFIYHTHWHDPDQLAGGIYGPLIVLEPGETFDPVTDHIFVLGLDGKHRLQPDEPFAINGLTNLGPLDLKAGVKHRIRFINITADNVGLMVQMIAGLDPARWTMVGKDGAAVPVQARAERPARQLVSVGETYDFELAPLKPPPIPNLWMEVRRSNGELLFQWPVRIQ